MYLPQTMLVHRQTWDGDRKTATLPTRCRCRGELSSERVATTAPNLRPEDAVLLIVETTRTMAGCFAIYPTIRDSRFWWRWVARALAWPANTILPPSPGRLSARHAGLDRAQPSENKIRRPDISPSKC